jgi:hypothetical protein
MRHRTIFFLFLIIFQGCGGSHPLVVSEGSVLKRRYQAGWHVEDLGVPKGERSSVKKEKDRDQGKIAAGIDPNKKGSRDPKGHFKGGKDILETYRRSKRHPRSFQDFASPIPPDRKRSKKLEETEVAEEGIQNPPEVKGNSDDTKKLDQVAWIGLILSGVALGSFAAGLAGAGILFLFLGVAIALSSLILSIVGEGKLRTLGIVLSGLVLSVAALMVIGFIAILGAI